jgi:hypothetical protein
VVFQGSWDNILYIRYRVERIKWSKHGVQSSLLEHFLSSERSVAPCVAEATHDLAS